MWFEPAIIAGLKCGKMHASFDRLTLVFQKPLPSTMNQCGLFWCEPFSNFKLDWIGFYSNTTVQCCSCCLCVSIPRVKATGRPTRGTIKREYFSFQCPPHGSLMVGCSLCTTCNTVWPCAGLTHWFLKGQEAGWPHIVMFSVKRFFSYEVKLNTPTRAYNVHVTVLAL